MSKKINKRKRSAAEKQAIKRYCIEKRIKDRNRKNSKPSVPTVNIQVKNYRDKNGGHPHVIVDDIDNNHVSVGFTHSPKKGKGHPNYALEINPLGGPEKTYMRRQGTVVPKKDYYEPRTGIMTEKDYAKAKEYGETSKRKYIDKNNKKK